MQKKVNALIDVKLEKFKNIWEEADFFWWEIYGGTYKFDRVPKEVRLRLYIFLLACRTFFLDYWYLKFSLLLDPGNQKLKLDIYTWLLIPNCEMLPSTFCENRLQR